MKMTTAAEEGADRFSTNARGGRGVPAMPILSLEDVQPGMVLAEAVTNHQGRVLLAAGRRITERSLNLFRSWGVLSVVVRGAEGGGKRNGFPPPPAPSRLDDEIAARFRGQLDDPLMRAVAEAAARQLAAHRRSRNGGHGRP